MTEVGFVARYKFLTLESTLLPSLLLHLENNDFSQEIFVIVLWWHMPVVPALTQWMIGRWKLQGHPQVHNKQSEIHESLSPKQSKTNKQTKQVVAYST